MLSRVVPSLIHRDDLPLLSVAEGGQSTQSSLTGKTTPSPSDEKASQPSEKQVAERPNPDHHREPHNFAEKEHSPTWKAPAPSKAVETAPEHIAKSSVVPNPAPFSVDGLLSSEAIAHPSQPVVSQEQSPQQPVFAPMEDPEITRVAKYIQHLSEHNDGELTALSSVDISPVTSDPMPEQTQAFSEPLASTIVIDEHLEKHIAEALALEEQLADAELQNQEYIRRQVSIEDTRIRALASAPQAQIDSLNTGLGNNGGQAGSGFGQSSQQSAFGSGTKIVTKGEASPVFSPQNLLSEAPRLETHKEPSSQRTRNAIYASIDKLKEAAKSRQLQTGRLTLNIQVDDVSHVKMSIVPHEGGGHQLILLVSNIKLRDELRRSTPELKSATEELPIEISEIVIDQPQNTDAEGENYDQSNISSHT